MAVVFNLNDKRRISAAAKLSRRNRFFHIDDEGWYLNSREGVCGPFPTLQEAEHHLEGVIRIHQRSSVK